MTALAPTLQAFFTERLARDKNATRAHPAVTVRGPGGIGKTALALQYARWFHRDHPGGVFLAHNVVNKASEMEPFLKTITTHPGLFTSVVSPGSEGMSVSVKLR